MIKATRHARYRAKERVDINLDKDTLKYVNHCIISGKFKVIEKQSNNRRIYEILLRGKPTRIIYIKSSKRILTVLPTETIDK